MPSSTNTSRWSRPLVLCCALVCFGIGFFISRGSKPHSPPQQSNVSTPEPGASGTRTSGAEVPVPTALSWEDRWRDISRQPACPRTTRERAALLEELARKNPEEALRLALAESNLLIRDELRAAALRGWAATAPDAAADWAMAQPVLGERMRCFEAVLAGAVENPADSVRIALKACETDSEVALSYGHALINALVDRTGDFKTAVEFARKAQMVDGQSFLIDSAYYQWAQHEPDRLFAEISSLKDSEARDSAMNGLVQGLANADPQILADFAKALPEGDDRKLMFEHALPSWGGKDWDNVVAWINEAGPHPDFDQGLSVLAAKEVFSEGNPAKALELTDYITDSVMRGMIKSDIILQWANSDPEAAKAYIQTVKNPEYRQMFSDTVKAATASQD